MPRTHVKKSSAVAHHCNPSAGEKAIGSSLGPGNLARTPSTETVGDLVSQK